MHKNFTLEEVNSKRWSIKKLLQFISSANLAQIIAFPGPISSATTIFAKFVSSFSWPILLKIISFPWPIFSVTPIFAKEKLGIRFFICQFQILKKHAKKLKKTTNNHYQTLLDIIRNYMILKMVFNLLSKSSPNSTHFGTCILNKYQILLFNFLN